MKKKKYCVIYTRFSPRRNAEESASCNTQEDQCLAYAQSKGWIVRAMHRDEARSGKDGDRPGLSAALVDLRRGDALLAYHPDRIARKLFLAEWVRQEIEKIGARIVTVEGDPCEGADGPEATMVRQIIDVVSEYHRKLGAAKTSAAMLSQQRNGKRVSRFAPYGWEIDPEDRDRIIPLPSEARAVERIRELAELGLTPWQVARAMDVEMPGSARGKKWAKRTVAKIVDRGF